MTNATDSAFPLPMDSKSLSKKGMTKREIFAAMAMPGFLANDVENQATNSNIAKWSVDLADRLIDELNKTPEVKA